MVWLLRQLVAIVILPLNVAVVIPWWIARRNGTPLALGAGPAQHAVQALGLLVLSLGLVLFGACLSWFIRKGKGTLAPWDPPRRLVVRLETDYREYRRHVPALLPHWRPWEQERAADRTRRND